MHLVSIDPGGTTGLVYWRGHYERNENALQGMWQILGPTRHHLELHEYLHYCRRLAKGVPLQVICERYDPRDNPAGLLISKEYIGIVELFEQEQEELNSFAHPTIWRGPPQKEWATNEKLEKMGLLQKPLTKMKDVNDAIRHLVGWICTGEIPNIPNLVYARAYYLNKLRPIGE